MQVDGNGQYTKIIEWDSRDLANAFSVALVQLVREQYPDVLTDQDGPVS